MNAFGDEIFHAFAFGEQVIHAGVLSICLEKIAARFEFGEVGNCAGHGFAEDALSLFGEEDLGVIVDSLFLRNDVLKFEYHESAAPCFHIGIAFQPYE